MDSLHGIGFVLADDIVCPSNKVDIASMEHPLFALQAGDKTIREYDHNGVTITIKPGPDGCATIHDKDVWLYCISKLIEAQNQKKEIDRGVRFIAYDFLVATGRDTNGRAYDRMIAALTRLKQTTLETNLATGGKKERAGFGLIDFWRIIETDGKMIACEVVLPLWLYRLIQDKKILTLSKKYFELRKPLYRRLYELARKHCGLQDRWEIKLSNLHKKSGTKATLRKFRYEIKELSKLGALPQYHVVYYPRWDNVIFYPWGEKGAVSQEKDMRKALGRSPELSDLPCG